jgi:putative peptidoglycan binding protein
LLDIREIEIRAEPVTFVVSDGTVPSDAQVVGNTWRYVNKNGQPDRRFSDNPSIPLAQYCKIFFQGPGLNEAWMLSNAECGIGFGDAVLKYKASLKTTESEAEGIAPPSADEWPDLELPERVPPPVRDWKTPSIGYGSVTAVAVVALIVAWLLNPQFLSSILAFVEKAPGSSRVMTESPGSTDAKTGPTAPVSQRTAAPPLLVAEIAELQQLLKAAGFDPGQADGNAGPRTRQVLTDWAKNRRIENPKVDRPTLEALRLKAGTSAR